MWCTHCKRDNHDDKDCWSTRVSPTVPINVRAPTEVHVSGEQFLMMKSIMRGQPQLMATPTGLVSMFPGLGSKKPLVQKKVK
jgi:hypothetical protein